MPAEGHRAPQGIDENGFWVPLQFDSQGRVSNAALASDPGVPATASLYGATFDDALRQKVLAGTVAAPESAHEPILWIEKISNSDRNTIPTAWDQGAVYASLEKRGGDAYGAAVTGYVKQTAGSGDQVGVHGRARVDIDGGAGFGMWAYADNRAAAPGRIVGFEADVKNASGVTLTYAGLNAAGEITGIIAATADGTSPGTGHSAYKISKNTGGGWLVGLSLGAGAILPSTSSDAFVASVDGEAIKIPGGAVVGDRYGGIRLGHTGLTNLHYGIRMNEASFGNNAAIWLGVGHRIVWHANKSGTVYLEASGAVSGLLTLGAGATVGLDLNASTAELRINNTKVVDARITGWGTPTGTKTRTAFDAGTVTLPQLAERVAAILEDLGAGAVANKHGLIGA